LQDTSFSQMGAPVRAKLRLSANSSAPAGGNATAKARISLPHIPRNPAHVQHGVTAMNKLTSKAKRSTLALVMMMSGALSAATAQTLQASSKDPAGSDVVVTTHHINPLRDARTPLDELKNCLRDTACAAAVNGIAAQVGIPAEAIGVVNAGAAFTAKQEGEETRYSIPALSGRKICRVQIRTTSVVPSTGDRASLFSLSATQPGVAIYTWTPRQGIGEGRSWYDGNVFVAHVKIELADEYAQSGKCTVPESGTPAAYQCRGASGVNNGLAACGSKDL
jgi:hypothetical protein